MDEKSFYFNNADEVLTEVNKVLATLKANSAEDLLDDGCDNENAAQNGRFCATQDAVDQAMKQILLLETRANKILDSKKMKQVWHEVCDKNNSHDTWLNEYNCVLDYYKTIKQMAENKKKKTIKLYLISIYEAYQASEQRIVAVRELPNETMYYEYEELEETEVDLPSGFELAKTVGEGTEIFFGNEGAGMITELKHDHLVTSLVTSHGITPIKVWET